MTATLTQADLTALVEEVVATAATWSDRHDITVSAVPVCRARLFHDFYQAHDRDYRSGRGPGLSIRREIVDGHNGHLRAEVPTGGGTPFIVHLPAFSPIGMAIAS